MSNYVGQQLGNYKLTRLLGGGGFADVYLGEHIHLSTLAAIKVLHTQLTSDDVELFRTEARTVARLVHPNIVRVLEYGVEGKTPFLVMDYAPNGTLRQRHPRGVPLPLQTIISYVNQIADALQYAHDEKLIHRDVKPENMLVGRHKEILLSDFGIAIVAQSSREQSVKELVGTVSYMAPEQIQGKPRPASDQYALGVVVYEWLCGERPFQGSFTEVAVQHSVVPPSSLQEKLPTISPSVEYVVFTALSKDPQMRFASLKGFAKALEQASNATSTVISPKTSILPSSSSSFSPQPSPSSTPLSEVISELPTAQYLDPLSTTEPKDASQLAFPAPPLPSSSRKELTPTITPPSSPFSNYSNIPTVNAPLESPSFPKEQEPSGIPPEDSQLNLETIANTPKSLSELELGLPSVRPIAKCPYCNSETRPEDNFCLNCGNRLVPSSPSPQQAQPVIGDVTIPASEVWEPPSVDVQLPAQDDKAGTFLETLLCPVL